MAAALPCFGMIVGVVHFVFNTSFLGSMFDVYIMNVCFGLLQLSLINSDKFYCSIDFVERSTSPRGQNYPNKTI